MPSLSTALVLKATLPVALALATGFYLRKRGVVEDSFRAGLMTLVLKLFFPALVLAKVSLNTELKSNAVALWAPAAGFLSLVIGYVVISIFARWCGADTHDRRRAFIYSAGHYNYSYLAIPVCAAFYGEASVAVLLLYNLGVELCFWTLGIITLTGGNLREAPKRLFNPITVCMLLAIAMNRTGVATHIPEWAYDTFRMLGSCAIPCGLLLVGMGLPALLDGFKAHKDARISFGTVVLRNGLIPLLFILAACLPFIPEDVARIILMQAAMPAGVFPIVMCQHYGVAPQVALRVFAISSIAGIATLPLWLSFGPIIREYFR